MAPRRLLPDTPRMHSLFQGCNKRGISPQNRSLTQSSTCGGNVDVLPQEG
jgi:hypothetical protein